MQYYNPLEYLLIKYPNKNWDIDKIFQNIHLNANIIKNIIKYENITCYSIYVRNCQYTYIDKYTDYLIQRNYFGIVNLLQDKNWKICRYFPFIKNHIDKYPIEHFTSMDMSSGNVNDILHIIKTHPKETWRINTLSSNPNITLDIVKNNMNLKWDWPHLSQNSGITMKDIEDNLDMNWFWHCIIFNPNFSTDMFKKYPNKKWRLSMYSNNHLSFKFNINIIFYILENYPEIKLNYTKISRHVTIELLKRYINKKWNWFNVSISHNITMWDIENNINFQWNWIGVAHNPNLTFKFIKDHPDICWDWKTISSSSGITMADIEKNTAFPWEWEYISSNPNLTIEFIEKNINKPWRWDIIGCNNFISDKMLYYILK